VQCISEWRPHYSAPWNPLVYRLAFGSHRGIVGVNRNLAVAVWQWQGGSDSGSGSGGGWVAVWMGGRSKNGGDWMSIEGDMDD
jgi:hypothetical protein